MIKTIIGGILPLILFGCDIEEISVAQPENKKLTLISSYQIDVPEPSGLSLGENAGYLWTVSDQTNLIYKLSLTGGVLQTLAFTGEDLEGIAFDSLSQALWVVEERKREIVKVGLDGSEVERHVIDISGPDNYGLEGIAISAAGNIWVVNQKEPALIMELNPDFTVRNQYEPDFAETFSGQCSDATEGQFWIVSAADRLLFQWSRDQGVINQYDISAEKAEGIAVDHKNKIIYIVSDSENKLYVFQIH